MMSDRREADSISKHGIWNLCHGKSVASTSQARRFELQGCLQASEYGIGTFARANGSICDQKSCREAADIQPKA